MKLKKLFKKKPDTYETKARVDQKFCRKSVIIHHYCPHTFNAGDHFVIHSIRRHIRNHIPNAVFIPRAIAVNRGWGAPYRLTGPNIGFSNRYADAVIVGGSDNYRNWSIRIDGEEIQQLRPPLFLMGLGVSSDNLDEAPLIEKSNYHHDIIRTHDKTVLSTVRDDATLRFLNDLGLQTPVMTGCPALFLGKADKIEKRKTGPLLLTFPFPVNQTKLPERFEKLHQLIHLISQECDNVILSCHDDRDVGPASERFPELPLFFSNDWHDYVTLYQQARMVVGSRLHGTILAASLGTPFLNINVDIRGQSFSQTFDLESWNLNYNHSSLSAAALHGIHTVEQGDLSAFHAFNKKKQQLKPVFLNTMKQAAHIILEQIES